ncbi:Hypothetical predicted protein, partial [Pelobates cultripes]
DVLLQAHYLHIKHILRANCNKAQPPDECQTIKILADLSSTTLRKQNDGVRFRWGYPTKMIVTREGTTAVITSSKNELRQLQTWGMTTQQPETRTSPSGRLPLESNRMPIKRD